MLKKFISTDITNLIVSLNNFNMKVFSERREKNYRGHIFPKSLSLLESNVAVARLLSVQQSSDNLFLVESLFIVDMLLKTCSCHMAFEFEIPCKHVCAVVNYMRQDPHNFVNRCFFVLSNYYDSYSDTILLITPINLACEFNASKRKKS